jgi:hypothetical protein
VRSPKCITDLCLTSHFAPPYKRLQGTAALNAAVHAFHACRRMLLICFLLMPHITSF